MISLLDPAVATAFYGTFAEIRDVQAAAVGPLISGRNLVLTSCTGSGKTEAVTAPLVSRYWRDARATGSPFLLYVAPTKALINDIERRLAGPLSSLGLNLGVRHGDRDDLTRRSLPHVLLTTPESLDVLLVGRAHLLSRVKAVVIDEVHLTYNTQRGLQLSILLQRLARLTGCTVQWAALSATIEDPHSIREFLVGDTASAEYLVFPSRRPIDAQIRHTKEIGDFVKLVTKLVSRQGGKLLVFADSRPECERIAGALKQADDLRDSIFAHYSSLAPQVRVETEARFMRQRTAICVATSTLELGIDIGDIDAVVLWGVPPSVQSLLQRIGRGSRRSHKADVACIVPDSSLNVPLDAARFAALVEAASGGELPPRAPYELFGAVGQQCLSVIASREGDFTRIADLMDLFSHRPYLTREQLESILAELSSAGILQRHGFQNRYGADQGLYRLKDMRLIFGNFGIGSQMVSLYHKSKHMGEVPAMNLLRVGGGASVRFAGTTWRVSSSSPDGIYLEPCPANAATIDLAYGGRSLPSDPQVADSTWRLLHSDSYPWDIFQNELRPHVERWRRILLDVSNVNEVPYRRELSGIRYYTFAGSIANRAVALYVGEPGAYADDISLLVHSPIEWASLPKEPAAFEEYYDLLFEPSSGQSIYQQYLPLPLQRHEFLQEWLKDGTIPRILERLSGATAADLRDVRWPQ